MNKFLLILAAVSFIPLQASATSFYPYMSGGVVPESLSYSGPTQGTIPIDKMGQGVTIQPGQYTFTATFAGESKFTCENKYNVKENDTPIISVNATAFSNGKATCAWSE